jgi:protease II
MMLASLLQCYSSTYTAAATSAMHMNVDLVRSLAACRLRDDARKSPAVLSYLEEENAYTAAAMCDTQQLQDELYKEMRARIQEADTSVATRCGMSFVVSCVCNSF